MQFYIFYSNKQLITNKIPKPSNKILFFIITNSYKYDIITVAINIFINAG